MSLAFVALSLSRCGGPSDPGEKVWVRKCQACHGRDGRAETKYGRGHPFADLTDGRWKHGSEAASVRKLIAEGDPRSPMPMYRGRLSEAEIDAVTRFVVERFADRSGPEARPVEKGR